MPPERPADAMVDSIYAELRRLAGAYVRREQAQSVQATELVHEAYLRLARGGGPPFMDRAHFIAIAAISMRRLLVERARARHAAKRGGPQQEVTLDESMLVGNPGSDVVDLLALDAALTRLAALDTEQARIVELRFFGGLSVPQAADALGISPATVKRHWTIARAWLLRELQGEPRS